jgi:hypothetical protein
VQRNQDFCTEEGNKIRGGGGIRSLPCIISSKSHSLTSLQDAIPYHHFYVIQVHDLIGRFSAVHGGPREKLWGEFFLDPWQWWNHR